MRKWAFLVAIMAFALFHGVGAERDTMDRVLAGVRIANIVGGKLCTTFSVGGGKFVTAAHCLRGTGIGVASETYDIVTFTGARMSRAGRPACEWEPRFGVRLRVVGFYLPEQGFVVEPVEVVQVGGVAWHPLGRVGFAAMTMGAGRIYGGMSGSPVVDGDGRVVGVLVMRWPRVDDRERSWMVWIAPISGAPGVC